MDQQAARALAERTGSLLALDVALRVTSRFLDDPEVENLNEAIRGSLRTDITEWLFDDASKTLRSIRMYFRKPERRRIREWLLQHPLFPEPGWEFRPGPVRAGFTTFVPSYMSQHVSQSVARTELSRFDSPLPPTSGK